MKLRQICAAFDYVAGRRDTRGFGGGERVPGHITSHRDDRQARSAWSSCQTGFVGWASEAVEGGSQRRSAASFMRTVISA